MKYKVGDKTLLGEIVTASMGSFPYLVDGRWRFTESEIDAIIIKPKRNVDHIIELLSDGQIEEANEFLARKGLDITIKSRVTASVLLNTYTEPLKYPKLTPDELRAVKWLVEGGFDGMHRPETNVWVRDCARTLFRVDTMPTTKCLSNSQWITSEPINLKELLKDEV